MRRRRRGAEGNAGWAFTFPALAALALTACAAQPQTTPSPEPVTPTVTLTQTPAPSPTPSLTPVPTLTATPDPYAELTIEHLRGRQYGSQGLTVVQEGRIASGLTRAYFDYESDGLQVHAFVDIPDGPGPFPVVLVLHGYIAPEDYNTLTYTAHYANDFARRGLHRRAP